MSHLLSADDSLLFFPACPEQAVIVHQALKKYQDYTGQLLSPAKCSLLSSAHCPDDTLDEIKAILQIQTSTFEAKYLGLPTPEGRMSADRFKSISERLAKRMNSWSEKFMSSGAKEVLIKSVAQAIPTYMMGVFKLPASTCDVYTKMIRDFWWGDDENKRKVHWIAWENLVLPKGLGGLGFRDLRLFNQALLGRQAWRLIQYLESLCARILKAKYYPNSELIDAVFPVDSSPSWKGIEHGLHLLKKGLVWRIGDGSKVNIWRDQWIRKESAFKPMGRSRCRLRWVSQLMVPREKCWDEELIRHVCYPHDAEDILKIKIMQFPVEDFPAWHYERTGVYSVRSAYRIALSCQASSTAGSSSSSPSGERRIWRNIWNLQAPPKVKIFAWRLARDCLATHRNRKSRKLVSDSTCRTCGGEEEDGFHAVISCTRAKALRKEMREYWRLPADEELTNYGPDWLLLILEKLGTEERAQFVLVLWRSWFLRNDSLFGSGKASVRASVIFLQNFWDTLFQIKHGTTVDIKGKAPCQSVCSRN